MRTQEIRRKILLWVFYVTSRKYKLLEKRLNLEIFIFGINKKNLENSHS